MQKKVCPICFADVKFSFVSKNNYEIYRCKNNNCNHYFLLEPKKGQGIHTRNDNLTIESDKNLREFGERNKRLLKLFLKKIPRSKKYKFLDFGSGCAHISRSFKMILGKKAKIYCLEANQKCSRFYPKWDLIPVSNLEEIEEKIDIVYMIEVIEHLKYPREILLNLKKVMDKNSLLFLSTPPGYYDEKYTNAYENPTHIHFFTPESLNNLLTSIGFKKLSFDSFSEMYPLQKKTSFIKEIIYNIKVFLKKTFINTQKKYHKKKYPFHLVGFTKLEI